MKRFVNLFEIEEKQYKKKQSRNKLVHRMKQRVRLVIELHKRNTCIYTTFDFIYFAINLCFVFKFQRSINNEMYRLHSACSVR